MTLDDKLLHRLTLRFVGAINEVREEKLLELRKSLSKLRKGITSKQTTTSASWNNIFDNLEQELSKLLKQISEEIVKKAIGQFGQLRAELLQKGQKITEYVNTKPPPKQKPRPLTQQNMNNMQRIEIVNEIKEELTRRNRILKELLEAVPQFKILSIMEKTTANKYSTLNKATGYSLTAIRNYIGDLEKDGFITIDKSRKPFIFKIKHTPWALPTPLKEKEKENLGT